MLTAILLTMAKNWKQMYINSWIDKKSEYTYSIEYLVKRKKGMEQTNHTQDLKSILSNNRTQAATYCVIPFM